MNVRNEKKKQIMKKLIKNVGVISPYKRLFDEWVRENKKENEKYIWICRIDNLWGWEFSRIERTVQCFEIRNYEKLNKIALCRVR